MQLYWGGAGAGTRSSHSHLGTADTSTTNTRKLATEAEVGSEQQQQLSDSISTVQVLSEKLNVELPFRNTRVSTQVQINDTYQLDLKMGCGDLS